MTSDHRSNEDMEDKPATDPIGLKRTLGVLHAVEFVVLLGLLVVGAFFWVRSPENPLGERLFVLGALIGPILYGLLLYRRRRG